MADKFLGPIRLARRCRPAEGAYVRSEQSIIGCQHFACHDHRGLQFRWYGKGWLVSDCCRGVHTLNASRRCRWLQCGVLLRRDLAQQEAPFPESIILGLALLLVRLLFFGKLSCCTAFNKVEGLLDLNTREGAGSPRAHSSGQPPRSTTIDWPNRTLVHRQGSLKGRGRISRQTRD